MRKIISILFHELALTWDNFVENFVDWNPWYENVKVFSHGKTLRFFESVETCWFNLWILSKLLPDLWILKSVKFWWTLLVGALRSMGLLDWISFSLICVSDTAVKSVWRWYYMVKTVGGFGSCPLCKSSCVQLWVHHRIVISISHFLLLEIY